MAASIYFREVRFFLAVTMMLLLCEQFLVRILQLPPFCRALKTWQAIQDKGFVRGVSPTENGRLPGVSQAHIRKMPCPELRGVFICHQIFIEQLLPARQW